MKSNSFLSSGTHSFLHQYQAKHLWDLNWCRSTLFEMFYGWKSHSEAHIYFVCVFLKICTFWAWHVKVILQGKRSNIYIPWTNRDRDYILAMHDYLMKPHILSRELSWSRSFLKVITLFCEYISQACIGRSL